MSLAALLDTVKLIADVPVASSSTSKVIVAKSTGAELGQLLNKLVQASVINWSVLVSPSSLSSSATGSLGADNKPFWKISLMPLIFIALLSK